MCGVPWRGVCARFVSHTICEHEQAVSPGGVARRADSIGVPELLRGRHDGLDAGVYQTAHAPLLC